MSQIVRVSAAFAALAAVPAAQALAADYDPPIFVEEAPEYVPVEIGSGWYLRGDVSYSLADPLYDAPGVTHSRFGGGVGLGYHLTDNFRADLTLNYLGGDRRSYHNGARVVDASYTVWSGLVGGYYDIATVVGITPYVGAGVGLAYTRHEPDVVPALISFADRSYDFAYALMAGASYKVSDNVSVDLGYQFLHAPDAQYLDTTALAIREGTKHHQLKVGLRYDLW